MNAKKAKLIRQLAKQEGKFKLEPDYRAVKVQKMVYGRDKNGKSIAEQVTRQIVVNINRIYYRHLKKAYKNGEFTI